MSQYKQLKLVRSTALASSLALAATLSGCASPGEMLDMSLSSQTDADLATADAPADGGDLQSIAAAATAFGRDQKSGPAAIAFSKALRDAGEPKRAFQVMRTAAIHNPDNRPVLAEYALAALESGDIDLAGKLLDKVELPGSPDWRLVSARGTVHARSGRLKEAEAEYRRALALAPDEPSLLNNLALVYALDDRLPEAETLLRKAVLSDDAKPRIRQNLALVLGLQQRFDEAGKVASDALAPADAEANLAYLKTMLADSKRKG